MTQALLVTHGGAKIGRQDLRELPTPEATTTFQPIPHFKFVEAIVESLAYRKIEVVTDEYAVTHEGLRCFGVMEVNLEDVGIRLAIGLRNGNDRSMSLGLTSGYRVFCCSNLAFRGEFSPVTRKHSKHIDLIETVSTGIDRIQRHFQPMLERVKAFQSFELSDNQAKIMLADAFVLRKLAVPKHLGERVAKAYFEPELEDFKPRTMWSFENAFTGAFKELDPVPMFEATAALPKFLANYN